MTTTSRVNPFFDTYTTLHETVPFDKIQLSDYEEAFVEGIRREDEQIERITNNPEPPTFDNTIIDGKNDKENYYNLLDRVATVFFNLLSAESNEEMEVIAQKIQPLLTQHANDVSLNERLFARIKYVKEHPDRKLTKEEQVLLDESYEGFVRSGALLNESEKQCFRRLTEEASLLSLKFSQNLLKEEKAFTLHIEDEKQLDGLPESLRDTAHQNAKEADLKGWLITLDAPCYGPFMTYSTQRKLREQLYQAKNTLCTHDNSENNFEICSRLINIRREIAQMLGYDSYADYVLKERMASNKKNVYRLLNQLIIAYKPVAREELNDLQSFAQSLEGKTFQLKPWDISFYSHKLQLKRYNFDSEMLRPFFELKNVINGVFALANTLYGISFKENKTIPVYHPDVKAYEVFDKDDTYLATFYADFYPRKGKQSGAWMTEYQGQWIDRKGNNIRPHVSVVLNITKPTEDKPSLLTLSEVETILHEFGHALHGIFANTRFESLSGTNVRWDFVELPSQFMENYAVEKDFLQTFAYHYKTHKPIPSRLLNRIRLSRNFMVAYGCMRQVSFALLDMAFYTMSEPFEDDIPSFERNACRKARIGRISNSDRCMTVQFSHIMAGGYAAGYYSYKWAEVLDADAFEMFREHGIFNKDIAQRFRDNVLSKGGTDHPMTLYKRFRGHEPTIAALMARDGIKAERNDNKGRVAHRKKI